MSFTEQLDALNGRLRELRGDTMTPARLLAELRSAGCVIERDGDNLRVRGQLTDQQRQQIKANKPGLLAVLGESEPSPSSESWDADEAEEVASVLKVRLRRQDWPDTKEAMQECARALDGIDAAYRDSNYVGFKAAVDRLMAFLATQPKQVGKTILYEKPPGPLINAWVRTKKSKCWLAIIRDCPKDQEQLLWEDLHEYTKVLGNCEIKVLDEDVDPNKRQSRAS